MTPLLPPNPLPHPPSTPQAAPEAGMGEGAAANTEDAGAELTYEPSATASRAG